MPILTDYFLKQRGNNMHVNPITLPNSEGQKVPQVTFRSLLEHEMIGSNTDETVSKYSSTEN